MLSLTQFSLCSDTVSRCGVFCSLLSCIEHCKTESVVDVFQMVKALRIQKPGSVQTEVYYSDIHLVCNVEHLFYE